MIEILIMMLLFLAWFSISKKCEDISRRLDMIEARQERLIDGVFQPGEDAITMAGELTTSDRSLERQGTYYRSDPRFDKDDGQSGFHDGLDD